MRVLAIDTSTTALIAGVTAERGVPGDLVVDVEETRAHNEKLMPKIDALLGVAGCSYADLDAIVVGCGPGPFTGLRVGMSTASALADALSIPIHGVCSHDATAWEMWDSGVRGRVLVAEDARRKEIYWSVFTITDAGVEREQGPDVIRPEALELEGIEFVSIPDALFERLPENLRVTRVQGAVQGAAQGAALAGGQPQHAMPLPSGLLRAAGINLAEGTMPENPEPIVPLYLRRPDAKEPAAKPKSPAIPDVEL